VRTCLTLLPLLFAALALHAQQAPQAPPAKAAEHDQQETTTIKKDVNVVNVLATVRNKQGQIVNTLTKDDFKLEDDGRPQTIKYFAKVTDLPLTLGLLVDTSLSQRNVLEQERTASYTFLEDLLREWKDKAFVVHFDSEVELLQDFTSSRPKLEAALQKLADSLAKPRGTKEPGKVRERIGRAKQKYSRAAQHYRIELTLDDTAKKVTAMGWEKIPKPGSAATHPGVYCLRTTLTEPSDAELWRLYAMLTNLEAVFRSLKTDLGLRPVHHQIERRVEGHLFVSVLAYYFVHTIRLQLKAQGIDHSWPTLRNTLSSQVRITTTLQRRDGQTVHVRKASRPEPTQQKIYTALQLSANPGGTQQTLV